MVINEETLSQEVEKDLLKILSKEELKGLIRSHLIQPVSINDEYAGVFSFFFDYMLDGSRELVISNIVGRKNGFVKSIENHILKIAKDNNCECIRIHTRNFYFHRMMIKDFKFKFNEYVLKRTV